MNTCVYCDEDTNGVLTLGRGHMTHSIACCQRCHDDVDKLPEHRKNVMAEYAVYQYNALP